MWVTGTPALEPPQFLPQVSGAPGDSHWAHGPPLPPSSARRLRWGSIPSWIMQSLSQMKVHLCQCVKVWERNCGEEFWPWHLWQCLLLPLWIDAISLAAVPQTGEKRGGHPSTIACVLEPQRTQAWAGSHIPIIRETSLHTMPPVDPTGNMALGGPLVPSVSAPTPCLASSVQCPKPAG